MALLPSNKNNQVLHFSRFFLWLVFFAFACISISGCASLADPESAQVHTDEILGVISNQPDQAKEIGQTFVSRRSGLDSVTIWLSASPQSNQSNPTFTVALHHASNPDIVLYHANYQMPSPGYQGPFRISFPARSGDPDQRPYLIVITPGEGSIRVHGRYHDTYYQGQAFINDAPIEGDLAFSTTYQYGFSALLQDLIRSVRNIWLIVPIGLTLLLPGWLLLDFLGIRIRFLGLYAVALASGLSLAILPVLMLWTSQFGISWNEHSVQIAFAGLVVLAAWRFTRKFYTKGIRILATRISPGDLALLLVLFFSLLVRLAMVRDYAFPPWVDSVHHGVLTRLIQTYGGFPVDYSPYFEIDPTDYHIGFHTGLAVFKWLSNLPISSAMLIYGQAINLMSVLSAGLFAKTVTRSHWAAVWASLAAGLLLPLPAYITSWGRYTHLTGLVILVACITLILGIHLKKNTPILRRFEIPHIVGTGVGFAGLILVHYRVAFFLLCWWIMELAFSLPLRKLMSKFQNLGAACIFGFIISSPWLVAAVQNTFIPLTPTAGAVLRPLFADFDSSLLISASGKLVLALALIGWIVLMIKHPKKGIIIIGWIGLIFLAANLAALGLPGGNFVNNISVEITLFIPLSLLFGYAASWGIRKISNQIPFATLRPVRVLGTVLFITVLIISALKLLPILNPSTVLAHSTDLPAIEWITDNIPAQEPFLINSFDWGYGICAGSDGGYWISPLAGNLTYPPPVLYGQGTPESIATIVNFCEQTYTQAAEPQAFWQTLQALGIQYIYIGSRGGLISADVLTRSPYFKALYNQQGVWILQSIP
jgi:hypothetical protein